MPRSRRKPVVVLLAAIVLIVFCVGLAAVQHFRYAAQSDLTAAIAEVERVDPDWSLEKLEAARAVIPDERNAALRALAAQACRSIRTMACPYAIVAWLTMS
jgi:hypothetical protein